MLKRKMQIFASVASCALIMTAGNAQAQFWKKKKVTPPPVAAADTTKKKDAPKLKPYEEVLKDAKASKGFLTVHTKDDKYYFEVPNTLLGRDILVVSRISKASVEMRNGAAGYAGDQIGETVYRFEKGPKDKVFLRRISFIEYAADSTRSMYNSVQKNGVQAIAAVYPVLAYSKDSSSSVFEATELLNSDNEIIWFQRKAFKERAGMGSQINEASYLNYVRTFPTNIEVNAVKSYTPGLNPSGPSYTVELNASMMLLPEKPMQARYADPRVGYFAVGHRDFEIHPQGVEDAVYIRRWRLEPKPEDMEKYKRGELVEPVKPIVFYIDPTTPEKWIPYLIDGVNDWKVAFERAGFKNAIYARRAPTKEEDSTWSIDDARHSAIVYRPSVVANAMGPNVADPRSGEILESHIFWYHNVMQLLQKWYMLQAGAVDPRARKAVFDDALMGNLIRFVSSHEVGHTLGLLHNYGASSTVPVEKLRDKAWVEKYGHTPSIMDYARFNYVAQPEDNIGDAGIMPRINDYDKWAIEWGYRLFPEFKSADEERHTVAKWASDSAANPRLWFGYEMDQHDPRAQSEDLGDDAMLASTYGIKNLKRIVPQLVKWTANPDKDYMELKNTYVQLYQQYYRYIGHVAKNIGGIYTTEKLYSQPGPVYVTVPYAKQKSAMKFMNDEVFKTPMWLNEPTITDKLPMNFAIELAGLQREVVDGLITQQRMSKLINAEVQANGKVKTYTLHEFFADLNKGIFTEVYSGKNVDVYRRTLQQLYVTRLLFLANLADNPGLMMGDYAFQIYISDVPGTLKDNLRQLRQVMRKAVQNGGLDAATRIHLNDMDDKIGGIFEKRVMQPYEIK
ncbi:zinc-dependent metalloprotease [uncultured Chitinophaga sp.]|uniref:zinc-dependent metalloprotease n=1 Tax=uncultured Chitinophaga sp. TaxID=339340 RepID=UPI0025CB8EC9|nr:zinc-dependent metalloprotease [uncultured Chitinophaga sp.]